MHSIGTDIFLLCAVTIITFGMTRSHYTSQIKTLKEQLWDKSQEIRVKDAQIKQFKKKKFSPIIKRHKNGK